MTPSGQNEEARKRCFDPIVDEHTRLLVLGSLPGDKSLAAQKYYGNPQNRFWHLMSAVIGVELVPLDYATRLSSLLAHGVGLWDVIAQAHRPGSLDSKISGHDSNDLPGLLARYPHIAALAFNGATSARIGLKALGELAPRYQLFQLPSSSPAYTLAFAAKLAQWQALRQVLG